MNKIIINHKICDNSPACGGIEVCPAGAMFYDEENRTIGFAEDKCIGCGACINMCPIAAIMLARSAEEAAAINAEIDADTRVAADLFVDRYNADVVDTELTETDAAIDIAKSSGGIVALELFDLNDVNCLATSVPISELFTGHDVKYIRAETSEAACESLGVQDIPAIVFFKNGEIIGRVQGMYFNDNTSEKALLLSQVKKILGENK